MPLRCSQANYLHQMITKTIFGLASYNAFFEGFFGLQNNEIACDYFLNMQFLCFLMACGWKHFDVENGIILLIKINKKLKSFI